MRGKGMDLWSFPALFSMIICAPQCSWVKTFSCWLVYKASQNWTWFPFCFRRDTSLTKQWMSPFSLRSLTSRQKRVKKSLQLNSEKKSNSTKGKSVLKSIRQRNTDSIKFIAWFQDLGRVSSFPVPLEYLLCPRWAKSSRVILMSCSKHFCVINHRFLSPSPNQCKDIYAEHIKALDTIEKPITPCKTFAFGHWHHRIIHYTLHMPAIYRKAAWPCLPAVSISATQWSKAAGACSSKSHPCVRMFLNRKLWKLGEIMKAEYYAPTRHCLLSETRGWPDRSFF